MSIRDFGRANFRPLRPHFPMAKKPASGSVNMTNPFKGNFMKGFNPFGQDKVNIPPYNPPPMMKYGIKPDGPPHAKIVYGVNIKPGPGPHTPPDAKAVYGVNGDHSGPSLKYGIRPDQNPTHKYGIRPNQDPAPMMCKYGIRPRG